MDTKLKKFSYGLLWVLLIVSVTAAGVNFSTFAAMMEIQRYNLDSDFQYGFYDEDGVWIEYESIWQGDILMEPAEFMDQFTAGGIAAAVCAVTALILLILILVFTGKKKDGGICLNWYDRIWSEIHVMSMCGFAVAFAALTISLYELWPAQDWLGMFLSDYADAQHYGIPNSLAAGLIILSMVGSAIFCLTSLVSLVKKLKEGQFWETSFIGGILLYIWRSVRGSDRTALKVMLYLIGLCGVAGFCGVQVYWHGWSNEGWILIGAAACILLILLVVPAKTRKFRAIRSAAAEIRSGNLACKVPVNPGRSGRLDELDRLAVDLNHIGEAQQEAIASELKNQRMKTELISNVSHDLKTPLTSMTAYIDLLKKEGLDSPNAAEYLEIIDKKTQRLKALTENLFEAAKASSGAIPVTIGEIDLAALVSQSLAEMEEKLSARGLTAIVRNECEGYPEGCRVLADGQLLWRIIENVLGNVSKYALNGSRVYVNMSKQVSSRPDQPDRILLEVKNISADPLNISADELMERFKRGDESRNTEGSGLGLAIARDLASLMGGEFEVSIDGDLFKSCILLDEAVSAQQVRRAESDHTFMADFPSKSDIAASAAEKKDAAMQKVRGAWNSVKEKAELKHAEKAVKKQEKLQKAASAGQTSEEYVPPLVVFEDAPVPEYETVKEDTIS